MLPPAAWKLCQTFLVHGLTVAAILSSDEWMHLPRDLDCVEIFAGVGSIAAAAALQGLRAATYDKYRLRGVTEQAEDITTSQGFRTAIALVLRLVPHGLLWLAPDCSSWGFMNCSRCQRCEANGYVGNTNYSKVVEGNAMAESSVFLTLLAAARRVKAALENPSGSDFWNYGPVVEMERALCMVAACTFRCAFSVAPFGKRYKKQYKLLGTSSWIRGVFAACRCPGNVHLPLVIKRVGTNGKVQINGVKARLRESGAYPIAMGHRVVECACPGQVEKDTPVQCPVAEVTLRKTTAQKQSKQVRRTVKKARKIYIKKSTSAVSSGSGPVSKARSWATPAASAASHTSAAPLGKARAWCTPSASSHSAGIAVCPVSRADRPGRSWCTPDATAWPPTAKALPKPSDDRLAGRGWLQPHREGGQ